MADLKQNQAETISKATLNTFFLPDPKEQRIERHLENAKIEYYYFTEDLKITSQSTELIIGCLLSGKTVLMYDNAPHNFDQFDFFFLPPNKQLKLKVDPQPKAKLKICLMYTNLEGKCDADFEVQHFGLEKFHPRGLLSSNSAMATYRTVWTAIKNGYYMAGFTNIPPKSHKQGVITSVNLVENEFGENEIYPHIHPEFPEVYIFCIPDENVAITQYLINENGESVCKDLIDGEGLYFPGNLGHMNFAKPSYKNLEYCMYMWIIPTFGKQDTVEPITLWI